MGLPDAERVGKALNFLCESDEPYARAAAQLEAAELRVKQVREVAFLEATGTQAERAARANQTPESLEANSELEKKVYQKELLKARRATALVLIDVWRTLEASQRRS